MAKLNNTGDTLLYSTFVGGTSNDYGWAIAIDSWGNATVAGYTGSTDFPATSGAVNETLNGNIDCFVFRLPDYGDNDADNLTNYDEYVQGTGLWNPDSDNDTMIDGWEVANLLNPLVNDTLGDPDLDLLINLLEYQYSTDPQDSDSDDDALDDYTEIFVEGTDPNDSDSDDDLLDDGSEVNTHSTDPLDPDSEDDGMPDGWEVLYSLLPLTNDSLGDPDIDGLVNLDEYLHGTNPQNWDSDDDDMPDGWEVANGLNPTVKDKSGDPDGDSLSNYGEYLSNTDPQDPDSDDDSMWDGWEVVNGLDPLVDDSGEDPDDDTLDNLAEFLLRTNPHSNDTDADTMVDGWEVSNSLDPLVDDTGGDPDGDLYTNIEEYLMGTDPQNPAPAWTEGPTDQSLEYGTAFMYDLNATDADGIHMWWINSTATFAIDGSGLITNITPLAVAAYGLEVHVNDTEGNYRWVIFRVTVADTLAPEWVEIPQNQHTAQSVAFRYDLNATDLSGLGQWWVNDSLNFLVDSSGIITNATTLPLGKLNLTIFVNDTYGNTRSAIFTITVHSGEAPIWEESPEHQQSEFGQVFLYDVNASGPYIIEYYWVNDTIRFSIDSNGIITNNTFLAVGNYRLEIRAYNIFGYYCNATINVSIIDTTNPTWDWPPIDQIVEFGQVFRYDVSASDLSTIGHWTISDVTNFGIDSNGEITNATFLTIGEYYVEIRAYDPYNNYCNVTFKITVGDTTSPTWDQTPLNQVVEYGGNLNYNLDASDLSSIDHWIVNDTVSFSISSEGLLENIGLLSVGEYHIEIRAYDPFSNYVGANITVTIQDTTDPTWDWTPTDQIVEFGDDFTYDVNASDLSGITSWWTNDTSSFAIDSEGLLTNSTPLSVGDYWIEIRAYDPYGNFGSASIKVTVQDTTSPEWIEIPVTRIVELGLIFSYDLNASDPSGIGQWTVDDTINFDMDPNGVLTNASTLSVGSYWIEIRAYDIYGNYLSAFISINVTDTTAPNWDVPPIDQVLELGHDMSYDLNASDLSGIDHWTINNTVEFSISSAGIVTNVVRLAVGTYWVEVSAYDPYGNILAFAFMVTVQDTTGPTWDPVPENQVLELGTGFLYDLDAVDLSTIDHWTINNTLDFSIDSSGTVTNNTALIAGVYHLEVRAYDPFNNYCFATFSVTVEDTTDPIWVQVPTDQIVELGEVFRYDVNATDLGGLSLWWINDTINFEIDADGVITNRTALSVRSYAVRVLAFDPSNNFVAATFTITVEDTSSPIWILEPTDRIVEAGAPISITLQAFDFSEMSLWAVNDTTRFSVDSSGTITNATVLTLGTYGLQVTVEDVYGNSLSANFSITVIDNSAPTWDELPTNQILEFGDAFYYNLNASDLSGIEFYWINDSDFIVDIDGVISSIMTIPVGEVVLDVRAYDPIGLYCAATFTITVVDTRGPSWVIAPSNQVIEYGTSFTYSLAANDLSGIDRYEMNNSLFSIDGFGVLRNATILNVGIYWLEVNAFDIYDNNCTAILSVTVQDTVAPSWTTVPANMNIEYGTHVLIISNAVDLSGIDRYWINDTRYFVILLNGRIANTTTVPVGIYALEIRAYDVHDNYCEHEFRIRIIDTIAPTLILTPDDVEIEVGSIGHVLAWSAYDLRPDSYEILDNEVSIRTGFWNTSSEVIRLSLDGLAIGIHEFTIIFMDESGNTGSDTVVVLVEDITTSAFTTTTTTTTTIIADGFLLAAIVLSVGGGTAVVLVIILVVIRRKQPT
ncbi:MAG: hypothetical protein ACFFAY_06135 [Promethearchaeota archaeon]